MRAEDGVRLHYVEAGPAAAPLLLFCHGFPEFWFVWRHQLLHFSRHYRVVALDCRGYNESDRPTDLSQYHIRTLVEDIKVDLARLHNSHCRR